MTSAAQKLSTRELTLAALFVAVVAVLSQIVVPMPLVPFNLALLGVFLCGALLRKGAAFLSLLCWSPLGCRCLRSSAPGPRFSLASPAGI